MLVHRTLSARKILLFVLALILTGGDAGACEKQKARVLCGIDVLVKEGFAPLKSKRVGLITNPTGVARNGESTAMILHKAEGVNLVALYGPEHGVFGDQFAGKYVESAKDPRTGLPAYSLYGKSRKPSQAMLEGIDVLVYDIQDIGCRSYTYISTMGLAMEAAGEKGIEFVVLDRPNPLGGQRVEGPGLTKKYTSFVSQWPVQYVYGMTPGEVAKMIAGEGWIRHVPKLTVIPLEGWRREMLWEDTDLRWVPTSPHIPTADTSFYYAMTGMIGELGTISNGVGYTQPFELVGLPDLRAEDLAWKLNQRRLPGLWFRPAYYKSFYTGFKDKICGGVQIYITDKRGADLTAAGLHIMEVLSELTGRDFFKKAKKDHLFNHVMGSARESGMLRSGNPAPIIVQSWEDSIAAFRKQRQPYLLYP